MNKILLIDGHSILNRAFYGVPMLTDANGKHTNAIFGFLNILFKVLDEEKASDIAVAFDVKAKTFRHEVYDMYKGTRHPMPEELSEQVPVMKEVLKTMGITVIEMPGFEADDIIGTLSKKYEEDGYLVTILSGDRDLLQLASDTTIVRIPKTKGSGSEIEDYDAKGVFEKYNVTPKEFIELKALMGDSSDNIKGAPGIGEKTGVSLISRFHSIENCYKHIDEVTPPKAKKSLEESRELLKLSLFLVTIKRDVPMEYAGIETKINNLFTEEAYKAFEKLGFKTLLKRFDNATRENVSVDFTQNIIEVNDYDEVCNIFKNASKYVTGVSFLEENNMLTAISLAFDEKLYYVPVFMFVTADMLCESLSELTHKTTVVFVSVKDSLKYLKNYNQKAMFDISIGAYLINPLKEKYSLEDYALGFLGTSINYDKDDIKNVLCEEAYIAKNVYTPVLNKLKELELYDLYINIEHPLIFVLADMENAGILVDKNFLLQYGDELKNKLSGMEKEIYELSGEEFNINSPKQLGVILFEKLNLPSGKKTKSGYSTSAEVLEKLKDEHPIINLLLEYRQLSKLYSTYAQGLLPFISSDGRIHGKFHQNITATGRISSTEPNLQNIPVRMELGKKIRKAFVPKENCIFIDADYSQVELRIMAHMSGDENLINAYNNALDIHTITASQVFDTPVDKVTPLMRRNAKAVNFGIIYGISSFGLSEDLSITRKEAKEYIDKYFLNFPKVKEYLDETVKKAKEDGYSKTLFGRIRPIPELKNSNFMIKSFGERVAMNSPIQGTAADIMKIAMINVHDRLIKEGLKSRIVLQIHDELLIEAYVEEKDKVKNILIEEMKNAADLKVKLEVSESEGESWFETK